MGEGRTIVRVHPQGLEDVLAHEGGEVLAGGALDDDRGQAEGGVVVVPLGAGLVLERGLALDDVDDLGTVDPVASVEAASGHARQVQELAQAGGMGDEVAYGDGVAELGQLRDVPADVVVQREQSPLGLQHDGEGGELLGGRSDVGARVGGEGDAVGEVGHAVGPGEQRLAVAPHLYGRPGRVLAVVTGHELVGELLRVRLDAVRSRRRVRV